MECGGLFSHTEVVGRGQSAASRFEIGDWRIENKYVKFQVDRIKCKVHVVSRRTNMFSAIFVRKHQLYLGHFTNESLSFHCNIKSVTESC